jgi:hypothetical protein
MQRACELTIKTCAPDTLAAAYAASGTSDAIATAEKLKHRQNIGQIERPRNTEPAGDRKISRIVRSKVTAGVNCQCWNFFARYVIYGLINCRGLQIWQKDMIA